MSGQNANPGKGTNLPLWSLLSAVALILIMVLGLSFVDLNENSTPIFISILGLVLTTVPSLIGAAYSERVSKDIRNGVVEEKVRRGTNRALEETGVVDAVEDSKQTTPAALETLNNQTRALNLLLSQLVADDNARKLDKEN